LSNVQLENGYTPIANEIIEQLVNLPLNGTQFKIILLLWRETYGFSRKECSFSDNYIASRLGMQRQNVQSEIKPLEKAEVIKVTALPTFSTPRKVAFNKNYEAWDIEKIRGAKTLQACKSITGIQEDAMPGMQKDASTGMQKDAHRKQPLKQPIKQDVHLFFESIWKLYPNKKGKGQVSDSKKQALYRIGLEELSRAIDRYLTDLKKDEWRKPQNASTFFNSGYVDYLDANYNAEPAAQKGDDYFADVL
jgi:phage replication O-like protein O